tara:strand:+ start:541 stop:1401 length:861 start_codon:yes stop_codon:yes gene_type:complete
MKKQLSALIITLLSYAQLAAEPIEVSLAPQHWESSQSTVLNSKAEALTAKSMNNSIWLSPLEKLNFENETMGEIHYSLRSGNLVIQANWFDAAGNYLKTTDLNRSTAETGISKFVIAKPHSDEIAGTYYRLKFWVEADMPNLKIKNLKIGSKTQQPKSLLNKSQDFETSAGIEVFFHSDGTLQLNLTNSDRVQSILSAKKFDIETHQELNFHLDAITASSACSIQLLFWDNAGTYLNHLDVLKDATTSESVHTKLDDYQLPQGAQSYSIKFWLGGNSGTSAQIRVE